MPTISFLILTYNSLRDIKPLFDSILTQTSTQLKNGKIELIVVDNNSQDNTLSELKAYIKSQKFLSEGEAQKSIKLIKSEKNLGYAKGVNFAATHAQGTYLLVINPDSELVEANFEKLLDEFEKNPKLAIAGMKIITKNGTPEETVGKFYNPLTFLAYALGFENALHLRFAPSQKRVVDFVSGGFVIYRTDVFRELKGYDEDYFMYVEDMDICMRTRKLGYTVLYLPYATIRHQGQGSSSREFAIVHIYKGLQLFYKKHTSVLEQVYTKNLLQLKALLIIFLSSIMGKTELARTYTKALEALS